jgi:hypothetical protein
VTNPVSPEVVRVSRAIVAAGREPEKVEAILAAIGGDRAELEAVVAHVAMVSNTLATIAAQMAAEAVARGIDTIAVEAVPGAADGVLEIVYRKLDASA